MDKNSILMIVGLAVFLFGAYRFASGAGLGAPVGLVGIIIFIIGWAGKRNDIKAERMMAEQKEAQRD